MSHGHVITRLPDAILQRRKEKIVDHIFTVCPPLSLQHPPHFVQLSSFSNWPRIVSGFMQEGGIITKQRNERIHVDVEVPLQIWSAFNEICWELFLVMECGANDILLNDKSASTWFMKLTTGTVEPVCASGSDTFWYYWLNMFADDIVLFISDLWFMY